MEKLKTIIVTGANSGLGLLCSKNIARSSSDFQIILACRDLKKAEQAKEEIIKETGNHNIIPMELNLSSLKSVREFAESVIEKKFSLYGIVCNAGVSSSNNDTLTEEGFDTIFGVNHLAHFLLVNTLLPYMNEDGKIAVVSSDMHNPPQGITWPGVETLAHPTEDFKENKYCLSKLCNLYFTYELARKLEHEKSHITINAFNPGLMTDTNFFQGRGNFSADFLESVADRIGSSEQSGKAHSEMMTDSRYDQLTARFIDRGKDVPSSELSRDLKNAKELWDASVEYTKS